MVTTNAMRLLTQAGIPFTPLCYAYDESDLSGVHAAQALGLDPDEVFKTLVLRGERTGLFVCCIPVAAALDLKRPPSSGETRGPKCSICGSYCLPPAISGAAAPLWV